MPRAIPLHMGCVRETTMDNEEQNAKAQQCLSFDGPLTAVFGCIPGNPRPAGSPKPRTNTKIRALRTATGQTLTTPERPPPREKGLESGVQCCKIRTDSPKLQGLHSLLFCLIIDVSHRMLRAGLQTAAL